MTRSIGPSKGESRTHRESKEAIFQEINSHPGCTAWLEKPVGGSRPDVFALVFGMPVAIEVQLASLSTEEIVSRTVAYTALNVSVVWVVRPDWACLYPLIAHGTEVSVSKPDRYLHALGHGRLNVYSHDGLITPIHLEPCKRWIAERDVGEETVGGYSKALRTRRVTNPMVGFEDEIATMSLADFIPVRRKRWRQFPAAMLWSDGVSPWWADPA